MNDFKRRQSSIITEEIKQEGQHLSRRQFVSIVRDGAVILMLPEVLGCHLLRSNEKSSSEEQRSPATYQAHFLTTEETLTVEALAARIIPGDERPGAREARVVDFIDHMLMTAYTAQQPLYRNGLRQLNQLSRVRFDRQFVSIAEADQDALLAQMEKQEIRDWKEAGDFFATIRAHTIEGMFSDPKYHGNVDRVGWQLMGVYD